MIVRLALDAMGGDKGASMVIAGADRALSIYRNTDLQFAFYGDGFLIEETLKDYPSLKEISEILHSEHIVTNHTKPVEAIRKGRHSNLGMAIDSVRSNKHDAVVSAGNTGAYMALSKIILKTLDGVERPAIPAILPTVKGGTIVLDLGANTECTPQQLLEFAVMGESLARLRLNKENPSVGLLNIGSEELKGNTIVQEAFQLLKSVHDFNFYGFVEGDDIGAGTTDVVVTDGFTGNVALKSIEGTVKLFRHFLQESIQSTIGGKIGYLIARRALKKFKKLSDPRLYNGAPFLGLQHVAIKSHGGTDDVGFANAIGVAIDMVRQNFIQSVQEQLHKVFDTKE